MSAIFFGGGGGSSMTSLTWKLTKRGGGNSNMFHFHASLGPILAHIFQMGWNHQPVNSYHLSTILTLASHKRKPRCLPLRFYAWQARVVGFPPKRVMEMEVPWLFEDVLPGLDPGSLEWPLFTNHGVKGHLGPGSQSPRSLLRERKRIMVINHLQFILMILQVVGPSLISTYLGDEN